MCRAMTWTFTELDSQPEDRVQFVWFCLNEQTAADKFLRGR